LRTNQGRPLLSKEITGGSDEIDGKAVMPKKKQTGLALATTHKKAFIIKIHAIQMAAKPDICKCR